MPKSSCSWMARTSGAGMFWDGDGALSTTPSCPSSRRAPGLRPSRLPKMWALSSLRVGTSLRIRAGVVDQLVEAALAELGGDQQVEDHVDPRPRLAAVAD